MQGCHGVETQACIPTLLVRNVPIPVLRGAVRAFGDFVVFDFAEVPFHVEFPSAQARSLDVRTSAIGGPNYPSPDRMPS